MKRLPFCMGVHFLNEGNNPWLSFKNDLFLGLDIVTGLGLVYVALTDKNFLQSGVFYLLTAVILGSHGFREWEYLARTGNPFCANMPLFVVNNLKLIGALILAVSGLSLRATQK